MSRASPGVARDFSPLSERPDRPWSQPRLAFNEHRGSFLGTKRPELETDHTPAYSTEVKNEWSYTFTSSVRRDCKYELSIISEVTKNL